MMPRSLALLLACLLLAQRSLAADEAAQQWLPVQGKVFVPGGSLGELCSRPRGAATLVDASMPPPPPHRRRHPPHPPPPPTPPHLLRAAADGSSLAGIEVELRLEGGRQLLGFPSVRDGSFSFPEVPLGVHTLTVHSLGLVFPTLKLDVGAARKGRVEAVAVDVPGVSAGWRSVRSGLGDAG